MAKYPFGPYLGGPYWPIFFNNPRSVKNYRIILKFGIGVP